MAQYYTQINANPHFSLRYVSPLLKAALQKQKPIELKDAMELGDIVYTIGFEPMYMELTLQWEEYGVRRKQSINIIAEPSNIRSLSGVFVYYFLCPRTGTKCRILYKLEDGGFCSRKAMPNSLYPLQMGSKLLRYIHYPPEGKEPYKRYGKAYYRGRLTPYGKRCQRYESALERQDEAFCKGISNIIKRF